MKITLDTSLCCGCNICQLACSFHHTGAFWPDQSSVDVSRNPQNGVVRWGICTTCDKCLNEIEPLCVKYCVYGALKAE